MFARIESETAGSQFDQAVMYLEILTSYYDSKIPVSQRVQIVTTTIPEVKQFLREMGGNEADGLLRTA